MKRITIRFEQDSSLGDIEVTVRANGRDAQVEGLIESLKIKEPKKLTVLDRGNCASVIDESDIIIAAADGKQVRIVTDSGIYMAKQSLQSFEQLLSPRFEIVNLKKVKRYDFTIVGTLRIEFDNGMETWASRRYIPQIRARLSGEEGYLC